MNVEPVIDDLTIVIPVREGSSRIEKKIFLPFGEDMMLLDWKIEQVKAAHPAEKILVSSNSEVVRAVAEGRGVRYHQRSDYLSEGHAASFSEVITGIVEAVETSHFAWVTVVVPLMSPADYRNSFLAYKENLIENRNYDSLCTVNSLQEYFWDDRGPLNYRADANHTISQELPRYYRVTNGLYMRDRESALRDGYFLGPNPYKFEVGMLAGVDIDYNEQYEVAKALLPLYHQVNISV